MATNVLLRDTPSKKYTQVGTTGNRFFSMDGASPLPQGGVVCKGFMQYALVIISIPLLIASRSFRYSNSGQPLLNLDIGFSAFLSAGPAIEVIAKILNRGAGISGRGGYTGGVPGRSNEISELTESEHKIVKNKLRGAKVSDMAAHCKSFGIELAVGIDCTTI